MKRYSDVHAVWQNFQVRHILKYELKCNRLPGFKILYNICKTRMERSILTAILEFSIFPFVINFGKVIDLLTYACGVVLY